MLSETSQTEKVNYCMLSTYICNQKNKISELKKNKQTYRCREPTSGYQRKEGRVKKQDRVRGLEIQITVHKIITLSGYIIQLREYSQYFIITRNAVKSIKILNQYVVHLKLI